MPEVYPHLMTAEDAPIHRCELPEQVDLGAALETASIDHLTVNEGRTIVIYNRAILDLTVSDGQVTAAHTFAVELLDPPAHAPDRDPDAFVTTFLDELLAAAGTDYPSSEREP